MSNLVPVGTKARVYVYKDPVNMGYSFPKFLSIVEQWKGTKLREDVSGDMYVFLNRNKDYCKILFQGKGGLCILGKKLNNGVMSLGFNRSISIKELGQQINPLVPYKKRVIAHNSNKVIAIAG